MQKTSARNTLFYGDNLAILREHVEDESVDLVYLDPRLIHLQFDVQCAERRAGGRNQLPAESALAIQRQHAVLDPVKDIVSR
jgi:hypothetical protein